MRTPLAKYSKKTSKRHEIGRNEIEARRISRWKNKGAQMWGKNTGITVTQHNSKQSPLTYPSTFSNAGR